MAETASKGYVQPRYERDTHYIHDRITADGTGEWPGRAGPLPAGRRPGLPVGQPRDHRAAPARPRGRDLHGHLRPDPRRAQLELRPRPRRRGPGARHRAPRRRPTCARDPDYARGITVPAIVDVATGQVVTNDFPQITLDLSTEWRAHHRAGRARPLPRRRCATEIDEVMRARLHRRQQRRLPLRVRRHPGGVRAAPTTGSSTPLDWLEDRLRDAALPRRRHDHRGRRAAVHHAGPLRRRLPRPLQVQPAAS